MIHVNEITKKFRAHGSDVLAINGVSFEAKAGEFFTLLGPSGCGKTTTMRCIAGLERPDSGEIRIGTTTVFDKRNHIYMRTAKRPIAMVFQSYAIWPHLNVFQNVAYPLQARRVQRKEIHRRVTEALGLVELEDQAQRPAPQLSGGQQQRVALARALVARPDVLILDEPLSNLDASLRSSMRMELKRLQRTLELTTVYVTHDQQEALSMSDEIAVMRLGRVMQLGSPDDIYYRPANRFVAEFVGTTNLLPGRCDTQVRGDTVGVDTPLGVIAAGVSEAASGRSGEMLVSIRPEAIGFCVPDDSVVEADVTQVMFLGESVEYLIKCNDIEMRVRRPSTEDIKHTGERVGLRFALRGCVLVPMWDDEVADGALSEDGSEMAELRTPTASTN